MTTKADLHAAIRFAELSGIAYSKNSAIRRKLKKKGYTLGKWQTQYKFFQGTGGSTQAYGLADEDEILISFRGTEINSLTDWLVNMKAVQKTIRVNDTEYGIFSGFYKAFNGIWPELLQWLEQMFEQYPNAKFNIIGHSLGAALCCVALVRLWQVNHLHRVNATYIFGCPRVVNDELAKALNEQVKARVFRFVNDEDLIANLPPDLESIDPMDYSHFGSLVMFDEKGNAKYQDNEGQWLEVKKKVQKRSFWRKIIDNTADAIDVSEPLRDHAIKNYFKLCKNRFAKLQE